MILTTGQVAKICHVSPPTVVSWVNDGALKVDRKTPLGGHRRFTLEDLREFAKQESWPLDEAMIEALQRVDGARTGA